MIALKCQWCSVHYVGTFRGLNMNRRSLLKSLASSMAAISSGVGLFSVASEPKKKSRLPSVEDQRMVVENLIFITLFQKEFPNIDWSELDIKEIHTLLQGLMDKAEETVLKIYQPETGKLEVNLDHRLKASPESADATQYNSTKKV